eukprot:jgi/Hompol1/3272/HPOL_000819-RA
MESQQAVQSSEIQVDSQILMTAVQRQVFLKSITYHVAHMNCKAYFLICNLFALDVFLLNAIVQYHLIWYAHKLTSCHLLQTLQPRSSIFLSIIFFHVV